MRTVLLEDSPEYFPGCFLVNDWIAQVTQDDLGDTPVIDDTNTSLLSSRGLKSVICPDSSCNIEPIKIYPLDSLNNEQILPDIDTYLIFTFPCPDCVASMLCRPNPYFPWQSVILYQGRPLVIHFSLILMRLLDIVRLCRPLCKDQSRHVSRM